MHDKDWPEMEKYMDSNFKAGVFKLIILNKVCKGSRYPYDLFKEMKCAPFGFAKEVDKSEVYNTLNALELKGLVKSESKLSGSRVQKKYSITPKGMRIAKRSRKMLVRHIERVKKLVNYELS